MEGLTSALAFLTEVFRPDGRGVELSPMGRQGLYNILREASDIAHGMLFRRGPEDRLNGGREEEDKTE